MGAVQFQFPLGEEPKGEAGGPTQGLSLCYKTSSFRLSLCRNQQMDKILAGGEAPCCLISLASQSP